MKRNERLAVQNFIAAASKLQEALNAAREVWPDAELYLANSTLNLMSGPHHEGNEAKARHDRILSSVTISGMDGGDW